MSKQLDQLRKLDGRLRCVANGSVEVNAVRAERNGAVQVAPSVAKSHPTPAIASFAPERSVKRSTRVRSLARGKQQKLPDDISVNVFVLFDDEQAKVDGLIRRRRGRVGTATVKLSQLGQLDRSAEIQSVELAETLKAPDPLIGDARKTSPKKALHAELNRRRFSVQRNGRTMSGAIGENVLIGIIDVGGIDFAHPDFLEKGKTRVVRIWDQGGDAFDPPDTRARKQRGFDYGSEIRADDMRDALKEAKRLRVSPYDLAPQSQQVPASHATHVASIAAGKSGICRRAKIAAVLVSLPIGDLDRRRSFYDTTRLVDAVEYLLDVAAEMDDIDAVSINISLGTNGGGHDGSEMVSRWIESTLSLPGRCVCVAAGNSGQEAPQYAGDPGALSGRIHASGKVAAAALRRDLDWIVVGDGIEDISENEMEIWYGAEDEFEVSLRTPGGKWLGPVLPQQRIENLMLPDRTFVSIYNDLCDPKNGDNKISIYLSPYMKGTVVGVTPGRWTVRLTGRVVRNGSFHAWIERDDPGRAGRGGERSYWYFPSCFGEGSFVDSSSVSSLACGPFIIGVANLDEQLARVHVTSSQGPTRDGRFKPDIAAPGTAINAARGFDSAGSWVEMTGTSMASPYVAGVAGLMLSLRPGLTAAQVSSIIQRTSSPLPGVGYDWQSDAGFGVIDPIACLDEVKRLASPLRDRTDEFAKKVRLP